MSTNMNLDAVKETGGKAMESLTKLAEMNMNVMEKLASGQMESMKFMMEQSKREMKLAKEAKGLDEFMKGQGEIAKETSERLLADSKAAMKTASEVRDEYKAFIQEGMSGVSEKVRKVVPGAK